MEWYWVLLIFFGVAGVLVWLGLKGKLGVSGMGIIKTISNALTTLTTTLATVTENTTIDIMALVMQLVDKAVLAAENAYYNNLITADQRYSLCMTYFNEMLTAAKVTLDAPQRSIIDALIKASCEQLGHPIEITTPETAPADPATVTAK